MIVKQGAQVSQGSGYEAVPQRRAWWRSSCGRGAVSLVAALLLLGPGTAYGASWQLQAAPPGTGVLRGVTAAPATRDVWAFGEQYVGATSL